MTQKELEILDALIEQRANEREEIRQDFIYNIDKVTKFVDACKQYPESNYNITMLNEYARRAFETQIRMVEMDKQINTLKAYRIPIK